MIPNDFRFLNNFLGEFVVLSIRHSQNFSGISARCLRNSMNPNFDFEEFSKTSVDTLKKGISCKKRANHFRDPFDISLDHCVERAKVLNSHSKFSVEFCVYTAENKPIK